MIRLIVLILSLSITALGAEPIKIVLVAGTPSHPPGSHEFNAGSMLLEKCLRQNKDIEPVVVKGGWPEDVKVFDGARAIVFYMDGRVRHPIVQENRLELLGKLMDKGVGMACLHYAVDVLPNKGGPELLKWIGGYYDVDISTNPHNDVLVTQASPSHPISRGWKSFQADDEWYYKIRFDPTPPGKSSPILTTMLPKDSPKKETIAWTIERPDGGRGFGFTGGHRHTNWGIEDFRKLVVNAILWTAKAEIPPNGAKCEITPEDLTKNLDDKPEPKRSAGAR